MVSGQFTPGQFTPGQFTPGRFTPRYTLPFTIDLKEGVHPDYFVKLDFKIAVDQQTRARD